MAKDAPVTGIGSGPGQPIRRFIRPNLRTSFVTGIVVAAPIGITIFLVWSFVSFVDNNVRPVVLGMAPPVWREFMNEYAAIPGLGLLLLMVGLTVLGMLTANMVGRTVVGLGDEIAHRTPIVGTIYKTLKQIIQTVIAQSEPAFKQVCLIEYPSKGIWRLAFLIGQAKGEIQASFAHEMATIFMPSTPNPMTGYVMFMPKDSVRLLDMSIEDGAKMLVSAGIVAPDYALSTDALPQGAGLQNLLGRLKRMGAERAG